MKGTVSKQTTAYMPGKIANQSIPEVDAESEEFRKWLPKSTEQFQLLHHVAIRNLRKGLILVGNQQSVMFGVFVNYKQETIDAYTRRY